MRVASLSNVAAKQIHIRLDPVPRNLAESQRILHALKKFGEVVYFYNLKVGLASLEPFPYLLYYYFLISIDISVSYFTCLCYCFWFHFRFEISLFHWIRFWRYPEPTEPHPPPESFEHQSRIRSMDTSPTHQVTRPMFHRIMLSGAPRSNLRCLHLPFSASFKSNISRTYAPHHHLSTNKIFLTLPTSTNRV
jgi:hypothetical protein